MAHTIGWARRLLRNLPEDPNHLLRSRSYADATFLPLFLDWLDQLVFDDPQTALQWARVAPPLALKTPKGVTSQEQLVHRERLIRAWAILGGAYRASGQPWKAEEPYQQALALTRSASVSDLVLADTDRRLSYLRACQGRVDEALELASGAVARLRRLTDPRELSLAMGRALISEGYLLASKFDRHTEAIELFGEALALAGEAKTLAETRLHESACHNLATATHESLSFSGQERALGYCQRARKILRGQKRSAARYRLLWLEARIWGNLGSHAKAERLLSQALEGFQALEMPWEIALVGLDLAALNHLCGEWSKVQSVAGDTCQRFCLLAADTKAIAALSLWNDAVKAEIWEEAKLAEARRVILLRMSRSKLRPGKSR